MENDNHEEYGNPRNTGRRGLQVEAKTKSLLWPHSIGIRGPHSSNTKKGLKRPTLAWNEMSFVTEREREREHVCVYVRELVFFLCVCASLYLSECIFVPSWRSG